MALLVFPLSLFALGLVFAIVDWIAVVIEHKPLEYVAKPATLLAFIAGAGLVAMATGGGRLALWFLLALVFSLLGDVFLMLPGDRWFPLGLGAFLLAQICYVVGLTPTQPPAAALWLFVPIVALDLLVLPRVIRGASERGAPELRIPIVVYGLALSLTLFSGWATWYRPGFAADVRLLASVGTTLFFCSDLMLAWDRFVHRSKALRLAVIVTYHLAQLALALAVGIHAL